MPIRFVDKTGVVVGRWSSTLGNHVAAFTGTFNVATPRTGTIAVQLQNATAAIVGAFQSAARTGTIASTLSSFIAAFRSTEDPDWNDAAVSQNLVVGVPFSLNLDTICTDDNGQPITYTIITGTLPTGLTQSGTRGELISGTPTTVGAVQVKFRASDSLASDNDFVARATAAGVKYATNFTDVYINGVVQPSRAIASSQDLLDEAFEVPGDTTAVTRETSIKLSGGGSLKLSTFDSSGSQTGSWAFHPNGTDGTLYRRLYVQFAVYYPAATLGYRWKTSGSNSFSNSNLKVINFGQFGAGQIVICNPRFLGFPSAFCDGAQMISDSSEANNLIASNPWGVTVHHIQDAIDTGVAASTKTDFLTRYGPLMRGLDGDMDLSYNPSVLLQDRAQPSGFPDTRAATNGAPFVLDGWLVLEAFMEYNTSNPSQSTFQMWAAPYGSAPKLIMNNVNRLPLGTNTTNSWDRFELLNYDTERVSETGVRPTLNTYYAEPIVSSSPIKFPGNFSLPGNLG